MFFVADGVAEGAELVLVAHGFEAGAEVEELVGGEEVFAFGGRCAFVGEELDEGEGGVVVAEALATFSKRVR